MIVLSDKLQKAMEEDEKLVEDTVQKLITLANRPVRIKIHDPAIEGDYVEVRARILTEPELLEYAEKLGKINPALQTMKDPNEVPLSPEENSQLNNLRDEFIEKATGISKEDLDKIGSAKIKTALFLGIIKASSPDEEDLGKIQKFRDIR